jgi:hypothetical protein
MATKKELIRKNQELIGVLKKIIHEECLENMPEYFQDAVQATIDQAEAI